MHIDILKYIKDKLKNDFDVKYRQIKCKEGLIYLIFIDNLSDSKYISEYIITPLVNMKKLNGRIDKVKEEILYANNIGDIKDMDDALQHILSGDVVILFSFMKSAIYCDTKMYAKRAVSKPDFDPVIKGPKESFNENLADNLSLIRKRIISFDLKIKEFHVGNKSKTAVALLYMKEHAPDELIQFVDEKITNYNGEFITGTNYIDEELKNKGTVIDTIGFTEKPEVVVSRLFEGRVVVLVDGASFASTAPYFFIENFQSPDDYHTNKYISTYYRLLRIISFFITLLIPGFYIALTTYHFSLIPTSFVFKLAANRAGVPFPSVVEIFLMLMFFELASEAGKRLPVVIGQALSIVSTLILGDAAVGAGLTSEANIVIIGIYAIASFINPRLSGAVSIWTLIILFASSLLGLHGFYIAFIAFISHIASLKSCGYPFLFPLGTEKKFKFHGNDFLLRDTFKKISNKILKRG